MPKNLRTFNATDKKVRNKLKKFSFQIMVKKNFILWLFSGEKLSMIFVENDFLMIHHLESLELINISSL